MDEWLELTDGSFKDHVFHVAMPTKGLDTHGAQEINVKSGRRIHRIERPFVDGQRTLDLGAKGEEVSATLVFFGPGYVDRFEEFKEILNEGTSGTLTLPDRPSSINATFLDMTETSRAGEASSKIVIVMWTSDEVSEAEIAVGAALGLIPGGVLDAVNDLFSVVDKAQAVIRNNPVLATVRQFETVVSQSVSAVVTTIALGAAVRARILSTVANVENAFNTIVSSVSQIGAIFGAEPEPSGFESGRTDPETGQVLEDADDEAVTEAPDPLAAPEVEPDTDTEIDIVSLQTVEGLEKFEADSVELMSVSSEDLAGDTDGRTDDVSVALTAVANAVRNVVQTALPDPERLVVTPFDLSLSEIMFLNDVDLNTMDRVMERNSFITDIHIVPRGSVVRL